jgi:selenophosphate synthetase-related protein
MKTALYTRVSKTDGSQDVARQVNDLREFAKSQNWEVVFEVEEKNKEKVQSIFKKYNLLAHTLGKTTNNKKLTITNSNKKIIDLSIEEMKNAWTTGFVEALK